jgi:hypothetical protein
MAQELFKIEPLDIHYKIGGGIQDVAEYVLIRPLSYTLFSENISAYVEVLNKEKVKIFDGFNKTIPTPEEWGIDDSVVVEAFAKTLKVVIVSEEQEKTEE